MRLSEVELIRLLPAFMRGDEANAGLAAGMDTVVRQIAAKLKLLTRWDQIDSMSDAELDELAWELDIRWYDSTASLAVKRALIKSSDRVHATLGTGAAVEQMLSDYLGTGEVREFWKYAGKPFHFKVLSDNPELATNIQRFLTLLEIVERKSARLDAIQIGLTGEMQIFAGMAVYDHTHEQIPIGVDQ